MTRPAVTAVRMTGRRDRAELPLLVLGPPSGATARDLWGPVAPFLAERFDVLAWDLPGHGYNTAVPDDGFTPLELAEGVLLVVDDVLAERGDGVGSAFAHVGVGVGGQVGPLLRDDVDPARGVVALVLDAGLDPAAAAAAIRRLVLGEEPAPPPAATFDVEVAALVEAARAAGAADVDLAATLRRLAAGLDELG